MTRAILVCFHKYTPFGEEYYAPMLQFFVQSMHKYRNEYDKIYFLDSNWDIQEDEVVGLNADIVKIDPSLRYYDAYKAVLPQVEEDLVLFMDNDMIVYREGVIDKTFQLLEKEEKNGLCDVVSIYDTIGTYKTPRLNGKNKFCPYWFATRKSLLMKYLDVDWGSNMPEHETLGKLTERMLDNQVFPYEYEEDKSNCLFDGTQDGEKSKDLGYYHIRAGSTPAYLLATLKYGNLQTFADYIEFQPQSEYLRQFAWYWIMCGYGIDAMDSKFFRVIGVSYPQWLKYIERFRKYYNLP